jgi:hypothetical protein
MSVKLAIMLSYLRSGHFGMVTDIFYKLPCSTIDNNNDNF